MFWLKTGSFFAHSRLPKWCRICSVNTWRSIPIMPVLFLIPWCKTCICAVCSVSKPSIVPVTSRRHFCGSCREWRTFSCNRNFSLRWKAGASSAASCQPMEERSIPIPAGCSIAVKAGKPHWAYAAVVYTKRNSKRTSVYVCAMEFFWAVVCIPRETACGKCGD